MKNYEITLEKYERCIEMSKEFLAKNDFNMALFWENAAEGFYKILVEMSQTNLVA